MSEHANSRVGLSGSENAFKQDPISANLVKRFQQVSLETRNTIEQLEGRVGNLFFVEHLPNEPEKEAKPAMDNRPTLSGELTEILHTQEYNLSQLRKVLSWMEQFI